MEKRLTQNEVLSGLLVWSAMLGAAWLVWQILAPFMVPLVWAGIIAFSTYAPYRWLSVKLPRAGIASGVMVSLVVLCMVLPAAVMAFLLGREALSLYGLVEDALKGNGLPVPLTSQQALFGWLGSLQDKINALTGGADLASPLADVGKTVAGLAFKLSTAVVKNVALFVFQVFLMAFALIYAYMEGERTVAFLEALLPGSREQRRELLRKLGEELRAIINGSILTCMAQGGLAGIGFLLFGVPSPVLFGCLTAIAALIPVVGTALVWCPAALYLLVTGAYLKAGLMAVWGVVAVGSADNLLRPLLIGNKSTLSGLFIAFGAMGGMAAFGLVGAVVGPFALAAIVISHDSWRGNGD